MNIITGQIYSDKITEDMLSFEKTGNLAYKQFIDKRLKPDSTKSIHEPIKKIMLNTCKSAIKTKKLEIARCALIRGQRNINMKVIVGVYELTVYPKSIFHQMANSLMVANPSLKLLTSYSNIVGMIQGINHH